MFGQVHAGAMAGEPYIAPGTSFTGYAHGMASNPRAITYGLDRWWVGCASGQLYSSPTGKSGSWTLVTTFTSFTPRLMAYANGRLIIVAEDQVKWSTDGSTFSSHTFTSVGSFSRFGSCYANGYFLTSFGNGAGAKYLWTADFSTWTLTTNSGGGDISGIVWDGAKFLAASSGNNALRYFSDPAPTTAWSTQGIAPSLDRSEALVITGSRLLTAGNIVGTNQAKRSWSDDGGASWTTGTTGATTPWAGGYSAGGLVFLFMNPGGADGDLYNSTDGGATVSSLISVTSELFRDVAYGDGRFTVVSSTKIYIDR